MTIPNWNSKPGLEVSQGASSEGASPQVFIYNAPVRGDRNGGQAKGNRANSKWGLCSYILYAFLLSSLVFSSFIVYKGVKAYTALEKEENAEQDGKSPQINVQANTNLYFDSERPVIPQVKQASPQLPFLPVQAVQPVQAAAPQCTVVDKNRFDCWPEYKDATEDKCVARNCCWKSAHSSGAPYCFFPTNYPGYTATDVKESATGVTATLTRTTATLFPPDIKSLKLQIDFQTDSRLRIKIFDPAKKRFEPPVKVPSGSAKVASPLYKVNITKSPFALTVTRASTGAIVFDSAGMAPFIFADQYIQIGTKLSSPHLYGLGEHRGGFHQDVSKWRKLVFWARDAVPSVDNNGYGSHPFYMNLEPQTSNGSPNAHGVLVLNSNGGDVAIQPYGNNGALTFRFTGGILDMFMFLGPEPLTVSQQYVHAIGLPYFPPFWSLGFHICKYGIHDQGYLQKIISRNRAAKLPYDVQWNDIDYMDAYKDFTYSSSKYGNLPAIVKDLHENNQRYIIITDPAISSSQAAGSYPPFDDGKTMGTFVRNNDGSILVGKVWPGNTAFPDFFHPNAYAYWSKQVKAFHQKLNFDGLWLDMNEPSSFQDGSLKGCTSNKYDAPPYTPGTIMGGSFVSKTICPSAKHAISVHYDVHNMYGWSEANISRGALDALYGNKRSPIISRSTFVSSGTFTGHWLGDNISTWKDLAFSIPGILNFNLFGIPLVGADICGFLGQTTPELCTRWQQLGVFYPFMRNHADIRSPDQDPGSFKSPYVDYIRTALQTRYRLLAVLYTGFYNAHTQGLPIVRPLFYEFPGTEAIDKQFMWTNQILVSPVLTQGATSVTAFIPKRRWYDFYTGKAVEGKGTNVTLPAPLNTINIHIKEGVVLPLLPPTERTDLSRKEKFNLVVATCPMGKARGELFWDDGESADSVTSNKFSLITFNLTNSNQFKITAEKGGYAPAGGIVAGQITVLGVAKSPSKASVNGKAVNFTYKAGTQVLQLNELGLNMLQGATVTWS